MYSGFISTGFSLLICSSFCSVNGQTLNQTTISVPFGSKDNTTMSNSHQQPSGALITQQEKEKITLSPQNNISSFLFCLERSGTP